MTPLVSSRDDLKTLQIGRAFAALSVVLYHTNYVMGLPKYFGTDILYLARGGYSGVHYFFVLSGFVIVLAHYSDLKRPEKVFRFLWKRFRRLYPTLWNALLLVLLLIGLSPSSGNSVHLLTSGHMYLTILSAFCIFPEKDEVILATEWTLRHEVLFYLVFALVIFRPKIGTVLAGVCVIASLLVPASGLSFPWTFLFSSYNILFAFGAGAAFLYKRDVRACPVAMFFGGAAIFAGTWIFAVYGWDRYSNIRETLPDALVNWSFGIGAALMVLGAANIERTRPFGGGKVLVFLGDASYSIYLVHILALSALCKLSVRFKGHVPDYLLYIAIAAAALLACIAFHLAVEKPLLRLIPSALPTSRAKQ